MEDTKRPFRVDVSSFLVISLLAHIVLLSIYVPNLTNLSLFKKVTPIKLKIQTASLPTTKKPKQIVETSESKSKKIQNSEFLGKKNTSFDRQTRARKTGSFKKAGAGAKSGTKEQAMRKRAVKSKSKVKNIKFSDLSLAKNYVPQKKKLQKFGQKQGLSNGDKKAVGLGRSSDFVKDIPLGDFTKLNTQEYKFYGFYHRIRLKLEQFWGRNLQQQADHIFKNGRSIASDKNHITSLVIDLNDKGEIVRVHIRSTSGVKELDDAAVDAFNQAGPFPNPPKKMLKNGIATIEWSFVVNS
jgi:TonB family protein